MQPWRLSEISVEPEQGSKEVGREVYSLYESLCMSFCFMIDTQGCKASYPAWVRGFANT